MSGDMWEICGNRCSPTIDPKRPLIRVDDDVAGEKMPPTLRAATRTLSERWRALRRNALGTKEGPGEEEETQAEDALRDRLPFGYGFEFLSLELPVSRPSGDRQEAPRGGTASQGYLPRGSPMLCSSDLRH